MIFDIYFAELQFIRAMSGTCFFRIRSRILSVTVRKWTCNGSETDVKRFGGGSQSALSGKYVNI